MKFKIRCWDLFNEMERRVYMFVDQVKVHIKAGKGGDGLVSFRHENMLPMVDLLEAMEVTEEMSFLKQIQV